MYAAYSVFRPGHPRWAVIASAGLLVLTLVLAAFLTHTKTQALIVILEPESELFQDTRVQARLPVGWSRLDGDVDLFPGCVAALKPAERPHELLVLFRTTPQRLAVPSVEGASVLRQLLSAVEPGLDAELAPAMIGPLPGIGGVFSAPTRGGGGGMFHYLARVAVAPDGQMVGLMYRVPRLPRPQDHELARDVSRYLMLQDLVVAPDPAAAMAEAGIVMEPPRDAQLFVSVGSPTQPVSRLRLSSGANLPAWYLDIARTPLVESRTVEDLVTDCAQNLSRTVDSEISVQAIEPGGSQGRSLLWADLKDAEDGAGASFVAGVAMDAHTALIMVGRYEAQASGDIRRLCESVVARAEVVSFHGSLNLDEAKQRARDLLSELAEESLTTLWGGRVRQPQRYTRCTPGFAIFEEVTTYRSRTSEGYRWWDVDVTLGLASRRDRRAELQLSEQYSLRDDHAGHKYAYYRRTPSRVEATYEEQRIPGEAEITREIRAEKAEPRVWRTRIDDVYACEPVLLAAASRMSQYTPGRPAVFSMTEPFIPHLCYCLVTPLGLHPLPQPGADELAWAVRVESDYGSPPVTLFFDNTGTLEVVALDHGLWMERKTK